MLPIAARNATERCRVEVPPAVDLGGRTSRCFYPERAPDLPRQVAAPARGAEHAPASYAQAEAHAVPLLRTRNLSKTYRVAGRPLKAVYEVTLELWPGETLGLVGESGSGKSSLAKLLLGLSSPDAGSQVQLRGEALPASAG